MDFAGLMGNIVSFAQNHTIIVIIIALGIIFFLYRKPKLFFTMLFIGLFLAGLFYLIMSVSGPGKEQKEKLIREREKQVDTDR